MSAGGCAFSWPRSLAAGHVGCTSALFILTGSKTPKPPPAAADRGCWLNCFVRDHLCHSAMLGENPRLSCGDITSSRCGFDLPPGTMSGKANHGVSHSGTGATSLAGRVGIGRRADRNPPSSGRISRQRSRALSPFADRLGPLVPLPLKPVPNSAACIISAKHGHDGGYAQFG